jgi:hypothetical protein
MSSLLTFLLPKQRLRFIAQPQKVIVGTARLMKHEYVLTSTKRDLDRDWPIWQAMICCRRDFLENATKMLRHLVAMDRAERCASLAVHITASPKENARHVSIETPRHPPGSLDICRVPSAFI